MRTICYSLVFLLTTAVPAEEPVWSVAVNGLQAAIRAESSVIGPSGMFELSVHYKNAGEKPLAFQCGNPMVLKVELLDADGKILKPTMMRLDLLFTPVWTTMEPKGETGFPLGDASVQFQGVHLDTIESLWKLKPGKYELRAKLSSQGFTESKDLKKPENAWSGELELKPLALEVLAKDVLALECDLGGKSFSLGKSISPRLLLRNKSEQEMTVVVARPTTWLPSVRNSDGRGFGVDMLPYNGPVQIVRDTIAPGKTYELPVSSIELRATKPERVQRPVLVCPAGRYSMQYQIRIGAGPENETRNLLLLTEAATFDITPE